mmetsp:Transcript_5933/g.14194  ORF Transcript_5933/g.14194 Transcript_5933/m.14194 type:complete len:275 (+) Transcript_5933:288-1112(+)
MDVQSNVLLLQASAMPPNAGMYLQSLSHCWPHLSRLVPARLQVQPSIDAFPPAALQVPPSERILCSQQHLFGQTLHLASLPHDGPSRPVAKQLVVSHFPGHLHFAALCYKEMHLRGACDTASQSTFPGRCLVWLAPPPGLQDTEACLDLGARKHQLQVCAIGCACMATGLRMTSCVADLCIHNSGICRKQQRPHLPCGRIDRARSRTPMQEYVRCIPAMSCMHMALRQTSSQHPSKASQSACSTCSRACRAHRPMRQRQDQCEMIWNHSKALLS